jgi:flagellar biosynthesis protein FliR
VTGEAQAFILGMFLVFMRVGTCVMLMPGLSAAQVPQQIRLYIALGLSVALYPAAGPELAAAAAGDGISLFRAIGAEFVNGVMIALPIRILFSAISFAGETITNLIGLSPVPGIAVEEASSSLSAFYVVAATALYFALDLHLAVFSAIHASYGVIPLGEFVSPAGLLENLNGSMEEALRMALSLAAPFFVFSIALNLVAGVLNRLTPTIPVYFIATPFLISGGILLLFWAADDMLILFATAIEEAIP